MKVNLNQAMRKLRRREARKTKALAKAPAPLNLLRPVVHAPTRRYNVKVRAGRGFTLEELKEAGISIVDARARGIAVDYRRRNKSLESLQANGARLKSYLARVVLKPKPGEAPPQISGEVAKVPRPSRKVQTTTITEEMRQAKVVRRAKQAVASFRLEGKRRFQKEEKEAPAAKGEAAGDEE